MRVREVEERDAADEDEGDVDENEQCVTEPLEGEEEQRQHKQERCGDDNLQAGVGTLLIFKLAFPSDVIAGGEVYFDGVVDPLLRVGDETAHVAAANAALERDAAAVLVALYFA